MKKLFSVLCLMTAVVNADPVFNPLPESAEYHARLCQATNDDYQRFSADRKKMDRTGVPKDRESWVIDYVVTTTLRDNALDQYKMNC